MDAALVAPTIISLSIIPISFWNAICFVGHAAILRRFRANQHAT